MARGRIGRAWGNALGGWRLQPRGPRGRFMKKGAGLRSAGRSFSASMRNAHKVGKMAQYRHTLTTGGAVGARTGAVGVASYALAAMNAARQQGYFINPEIGLSGAGISVGYGHKISPKWRASISVKVAVQRTDGGPINAAIDNFVNNSLQGAPAAQSLIKYGVADTGIHDTVIVRQGDKLKLKSGRKANIARRRNPAYRSSADRTARNKKPYRAERRNSSKRSADIGNGHKIVKPKRYDTVRTKNEFGTYTTSRQKAGTTKLRSNKKGVARTITA